MKKQWIILIGAVVLVVAIALVGCGSDQVKLSTDNGELKISLDSQSQGIWVNGNGKVYASPDIAILSLGIEVQEETVALAQANASEAMNKVIDTLKNQGVADEDIQTQQFNISKISEWKVVYGEGEKEVITGYRVTNIVSVKVRDINKVGVIIDAVAAAGGDLTRIDSIGFTVDDPTPYYEEARAQAVEYAKAKAEQLAELSGVELGKPSYISESTYYSSPNYYRGDMSFDAIPAAETSISPGELEISATVQIAFAIND
ncbi:MAG TPA: SIMPL domain-containing protein [Dehalococcoidia bacterium]|nr:SIMPL domain-containing protein [Dehalococcoidia bacterium]